MGKTSRLQRKASSADRRLLHSRDIVAYRELRMGLVGRSVLIIKIVTKVVGPLDQGCNAKTPDVADAQSPNIANPRASRSETYAQFDCMYSSISKSNTNDWSLPQRSLNRSLLPEAFIRLWEC